jgi:hypothetical protein
MEATALKALIASLLAWMNIHAGYQLPAQHPEIISVPHTVLEQMACTGPCPIMGLYPDDGVVYLDEDLSLETNACAQSVLLHELVHYVQDVNDRFVDKDPILRWQIRELEARNIQNLFLSQHGRRFLFERNIALRAFIGPTC